MSITLGVSARLLRAAVQRRVLPVRACLDSSRYLSTVEDYGKVASESIGVRDQALRAEHHRVRESYPTHAHPRGVQVGVDEAHRKRMIYRSKQRGWLELDLLLGSFAAKFVPEMTAGDLVEYEVILNCETIDIYKYITGEQEVPDEIMSPMMTRLQKYAQTSPAGQASPEAYSTIKSFMSN